MTHLDCVTEAIGPVAVARLRGTLTMVGAPSTRRTLFKCLAEQPEALVIDASDLMWGDDGSASVFLVIARQASQWPGIPVIVCGPRASAAVGRFRGLTVCDDWDEAMKLAQNAPAPKRVRDDLLPVLASARRARDIAIETCLRWDLADLVPAASVVASELVTNGVRHAGTGLGLSVSRQPRYLHIAVQDGSREPIVRRYPDVFAPSGRGLMIVESLTMSWGWLPLVDGKVVWAALAIS